MKKDDIIFGVSLAAILAAFAPLAVPLMYIYFLVIILPTLIIYHTLDIIGNLILGLILSYGMWIAFGTDTGFIFGIGIGMVIYVTKRILISIVGKFHKQKIKVDTPKN